MTSGKQLYRANGTPLGGVCAGVADYFDIDAIVARILAVTGTVMTGGLLGVAYVAMVVVVPKAPDCSSCYDVRPQAAVSDRFGPISCKPQPSAPPHSPHAVSGAVRCGVGHTPPEPPSGAGQATEDGLPFYEFYQRK